MKSKMYGRFIYISFSLLLAISVVGLVFEVTSRIYNQPDSQPGIEASMNRKMLTPNEEWTELYGDGVDSRQTYNIMVLIEVARKNQIKN